SVFCLNEHTCLAVGDGGTILKTTDGGITWIQQLSGTTRRLTSVACPDSRICFAAGDSGLVLKNLHGGETSVPALTEETETRIYPQPCTSTITIRPATAVLNATVTMFNLFGREIGQINS